MIYFVTAKKLWGRLGTLFENYRWQGKTISVTS
jgi:hypothetical protein